jgi:hypothetical protein
MTRQAPVRVAQDSKDSGGPDRCIKRWAELARSQPKSLFKARNRPANRRKVSRILLAGRQQTVYLSFPSAALASSNNQNNSLINAPSCTLRAN